ncbi:aerobic glycerol-3-phosphate dehydrogenase [Oceaniovalibus guishaninsula JLT2003]|uniref:Glycerol-3-phosphate dehydrogenase n=1 Tax=Oceaniovalibus guishaninsula JLT2003 TaxID=1231392 RepID=K2GSE1_9RHOB|nr:glycerol-3-phosphate dehydrogenase [Oceaniovalibus guishaninsula]EKE45506.1 aerobic glycerol-3-phosphate dehydrogenase [Oceaniovalibus guishaninsula JLT2003]
MTDAAPPAPFVHDLFVIGGGVNGTGIARDASGRGLTVALAEMGDLAQATSSASTKLFHGGLRYLEFFEIGLVKKALVERETLLEAMPHISWPMRFVLPYSPDMRFEGDTPTSRLLGWTMPWMKGRRPGWLVRFGLLLYDTLGGRKYLPGTATLRLAGTPEGAPLQDRFAKAWEYSDCWVEDARLVALNARDAAERGARIMVRARVTAAERAGDHWRVTVEHESGAQEEILARGLINAGGPWVETVLRGALRRNTSEGVRLVRGSHIVTRRLFDHDKAYFFQGEDGRIIFAIPYEGDFTLIGTTDKDHGDDPSRPAVCTDEEADYLCRFASGYLKRPVTRADVVWTYSGVRPLYDDGAKSATAATRDYVLSLDAGPATDGGAGSEPPLLSVFGGKITTYRKLAEQALARLRPFYPAMTGDWTAGVALPGGDFEVQGGYDRLVGELKAAHPFLEDAHTRRLVRAYGTDAARICEGAVRPEDLGRRFMPLLTEAEVRWLMRHEFARTAEDVVWRRTKLGLRMDEGQIAALERWMQGAMAMAAE